MQKNFCNLYPSGALQKYLVDLKNDHIVYVYVFQPYQ